MDRGRSFQFKGWIAPIALKPHPEGIESNEEIQNEPTKNIPHSHLADGPFINPYHGDEYLCRRERRKEY
jgi:hypothetical protein